MESSASTSASYSGDESLKSFDTFFHGHCTCIKTDFEEEKKSESGIVKSPRCHFCVKMTILSELQNSSDTDEEDEDVKDGEKTGGDLMNLIMFINFIS